MRLRRTLGNTTARDRLGKKLLRLLGLSGSLCELSVFGGVIPVRVLFGLAVYSRIVS